MQNTLTQKFLELATEYQEVQTSYKSKYQEKIERQYKIAKPDATQDEIEEAIESGDSSKVFANQILDSHLHQQVRTIYSSCSADHFQAKNALAYIEARHADIKRIEASIQQLHQLFVDILFYYFSCYLRCRTSNLDTNYIWQCSSTCRVRC